MSLGVGLAFFTEILGWPFNSGKMAGFFAVFVFMVMGVSVCLLAFAGLRPQVLLFDKTTKRLTGKFRARFWLLKNVDVEFGALKMPTIKTIERESDSDLFEIRIEADGKRVFSFGAYESPADANYWKRQIENIIQT